MVDITYLGIQQACSHPTPPCPSKDLRGPALGHPEVCSQLRPPKRRGPRGRTSSLVQIKSRLTRPTFGALPQGTPRSTESTLIPGTPFWTHYYIHKMDETKLRAKINFRSLFTLFCCSLLMRSLTSSKYTNSKYILKASNFGIYLTLNYSHQFVK